MIKIIKFFWNDIKSDFVFIWKLIRQDPKLKEHLALKKAVLKQEWEQTTPQDLILGVLKEYWIWYILIVLAFAVGWFFAAKYYQQTCNEFIFTNYIIPKQIINISSNFSMI